MALTCASGGTFSPAGYSCSFGQSTVAVNNAVATTTLTFAPSSSSTTMGARARRPALELVASFGGISLGAVVVLLGIGAFGAVGVRNGRNFFVACGLVVSICAAALGCGGGGGGGGGGPFTTTTTMVSTNLHAPFGTPVTFTVTVKPSGAATPSGMVQLYDNGRAYLSSVNVSAGIATFLATSLPVGMHSLTAKYLGDTHTLASTSAPINQVITGQVPLEISGVSGGSTETVNFAVVVN